MAKSSTIKEEKPLNKKKQNEKEPIHKVINSFYANGIMANFNEDEFVIDFYQNPIQDDGTVDTFRLFLNPDIYKKFYKLTEKMINEYEKEFGKIKISIKSIEKIEKS